MPRTGWRRIAGSAVLLVTAVAIGQYTVGAAEGDPADESVRGEMQMVMGMTDDGQTTHQMLLETPDGTTYELTGSDEHTMHGLGATKVEVTGDIDPAAGVIDVEHMAALDTAPIVAAAPARPKALAVIFTIASKPEWPAIMNEAQARTILDTDPRSLRNFWLAESRNTIDLDVSVTTHNATMDVSESSCDIAMWRTYFRGKFPGYDYLLLFGPRGTCSSGGVAYLGGTKPVVSGYFNYGGSYRLVYHEMGHNLSMYHSRSADCRQNGSRVPIGGTCQSPGPDPYNGEYGDDLDPMGSGYCAYNAFNRKKGRLPVDIVNNTSGSGVYTLQASDGDYAAGKAQAIAVARDNPDGYGTRYYVEWHKQDFPGCGSEGPSTGLQIRTGPDYESASESTCSKRDQNGTVWHGQCTYLVDTTPETSTYRDAALGVGRTFTDAKTGVSITLDALTATEATVRVTRGGAPPSTTPPTTTPPTTTPPSTTPPTTTPPGPGAGTAEVKQGTLQFKAGAGRANDVTITQQGNDVVVTDVHAIAPGKSCATVTVTSVRCMTPKRVRARLGDGNDTARSTASLPVRIDGEDGDDAYVANAAADGRTDFRGGNGIDRVDYSARTAPVKVAFDGTANDGGIDEHDRVGTDVEVVIGGKGNDTLKGNNGVNTLDGGAGDDVITGRGAADRLLGNSGNDELQAKDSRADIEVACGTGTDVVVYDAGIDTLNGDCEQARTR